MKDRKESMVVILGAGRLGGAFHRALVRSGVSSTLISRPKTPSAIQSAREVLGRAQIAFLCVPDGQIFEVASTYADVFHAGQIVAHCAGALSLAPLRPISALGIDVGSLHPLCAIASPETSFQGIRAAVSGSDHVSQKLSALARSAGMLPFYLKDTDRPRYHAAAVLASNCIVALAAHSSELFQSCGLTPNESVSALLPLMRSALVALEQRGLPSALTGPIARGDQKVVVDHLEALQRPGDEEVRRTYVNLSKRLLKISRQLGAAPAESLDAISRALAEADLETRIQK